MNLRAQNLNSPVPLPDLQLIVSCVPPQELDILGGQSHALAGPLVPPEPLPMAPGTWDHVHEEGSWSRELQ